MLEKKTVDILSHFWIVYSQAATVKDILLVIVGVPCFQCL